MYNLINDLIEKQGGISIKSDLEFKKYYENKLREIFIESDSDNLVDLNRELLRHHIIYYKNKENTNANNHMLSIPKTEIEDTKKDNNDVDGDGYLGFVHNAVINHHLEGHDEWCVNIAVSKLY